MVRQVSPAGRGQVWSDCTATRWPGHSGFAAAVTASTGQLRNSSINFYLKGRETEKSHLLFLSPAACNGQGWAGLKPGAGSVVGGHVLVLALGRCVWVRRAKCLLVSMPEGVCAGLDAEIPAEHAGCF